MPKIESTPPPWRWQKVGPEYVLWRDAGMRDVVLDTSRNGKLRVRIDGIMCAFYPDHPDMKLIAAAPDLKIALARMVKNWKGACDCAGDFVCATCHARQVLEKLEEK